jgi:hypothetical protein
VPCIPNKLVFLGLTPPLVLAAFGPVPCQYEGGSDLIVVGNMYKWCSIARSVTWQTLRYCVPGGQCHKCWAGTCWQLLLARNVCMPEQPCACVQYCCCLTLHCCRQCHTHRACVAAAVLQVCDAVCSHPAVGCTPYTHVHTGQDKAGATPRVPGFDQRHSVSRWNSGDVITCASGEFWRFLGTSCCSVQQSGGRGVSRSGQFNPVIAYVTLAIAVTLQLQH